MPSRRPLRDRLPRIARPNLLPSLYERYPHAATAARRPRGLEVVPLEMIVGTTRHPTQNTADFLPLPRLRGKNWAARWQRIREAVERLAVLPAVDLVRVGDEYYVADGHNRVAAALAAGAVAIDADVTELLLPGAEAAPRDEARDHNDAASILLGAEEVRDAVAGRSGRTYELRSSIDRLRREELAGGERPGGEGRAETGGSDVMSEPGDDA